MFHQHEDKVMKAADCGLDGPSSQHMFAVSARVKRRRSRVKNLLWLQIQLLVVLLAAQASCQEITTTTSFPSSTTNAQTSVHYFVSVNVDVTGKAKNESEIKAWLVQVFKNNLLNCVSSVQNGTTASPTTTQNTSVSTNETATTQSNNTTATTIALQANSTSNTTAGATSTSQTSNTTTAATTSQPDNATTAATSSQTNNTTTDAPLTSQTSSNTTTHATSQTSSNTTTHATSQTRNTTTPATSTSETSNTTTATPSIASTTATTSTGLTSATTSTGSTAATSTGSTATTTSTGSTATTTSTGSTTATTSTGSTAATSKGSTTETVIDSSGNTKSPSGGGNDKTKNPKTRKRSVREIVDSVTASSGVTTDHTAVLFQGVELSCLKQTAIKETNCTLVLKLTRSVSPCCILRTLCAASKASSDIHVLGNKADRIGPLQNECDTVPQEAHTCAYNGQSNASCELSGPVYQFPLHNSTYCNISTDKQKNCNCSSYCNGTDAFYTLYISMKDPEINILSLISKIGIPPNCSSTTDDPCPFSTIAFEYKDANVTCRLTASDLKPCVVILRFSHEVPICNVSAAVMNVLQSEKQISFNGSVTRTAICGNAVNDNPLQPLVTWVQMSLKPALFCPAMEESNMLTCPKGQNTIVLLQDRCDLPTTTPGPNVTTSQPNTTALPVNFTSSPLNTTAEALNATTTITTTGAANATVTTTLNATTAKGPGSVTPSEAPTTTLSADSQANALLEMTRDVSKLNSSQIDQLVSQLENLLSGPTVSLALGNTSVHIVSNLLGASPEKLADSSNRIIGIVDTVALKLVLEDQPETLLSPAVALSVKPADGTNFQETFFSISDPSTVQVRGNPRLRRSVRGDSSIPQGSIRLPPSLTEDLPSEEQQLASRVQFNFYQKSTVFQDKSLGERRLNSGILGASVANLSITGLQDDVVIHLRNKEPVPANYVAKCVFWDFTFNNGSGGWNSNGCSVRNSTDNETICGCNHLTSFAILLDLSRQPLTSRLQATILTFITYIGCGISAIFLSITLLTYLSFGKLRKDIPSKILIQLCLALLLLNLVFLVDAWLALYPDAVGLCISTAWFLHYFLLVSFTWMGLEAVHMYLALVKVFNSYISRYMVKFSLVGWGVPMLVVIIVIAIDKDNYGLVSYGKFSDGTSDDFCWLKNDVAFYVAVVAYFCIIFLFNLVMFVVVLVQLYRIKKQNPQNALHRTTLQDVRSVAGITILLGLTWGFAFFAWGPLNLPFMYLFAIFNSLQGFFIFIFHCAVKENVRRQWRTYLCCGKMRLAENSEWSRTATQKTVKKSSVTRLTSLQSSKSSRSNNSSSSSSFLVSDSSENVNGIGSPFEDRQITADEDPSVDVILNEINSQYRNRQAT